MQAAFVGYGKQGRNLRNCIDSDVLNVVAICDIKTHTKADAEQPGNVKWIQDWHQLLHDERIEAVLIATPLCDHAEIAIACLEAGKHVFCETAMSMDPNGSRQMIQSAEKRRRILHVGYQDVYEPIYWTAYHNIVKQGILGDIHFVEAACHTFDSGRLPIEPEMSFDPRPWGYLSLERLVNWRLYRSCSNGLIGEAGARLVSLMNWFLDDVPVAVQAQGGNYTFLDGRDVDDHVFATLEYPSGRTATLSLIQSNGFESSYTQFKGTKGTLIIGMEEALLFTEEGSGHAALNIARLDASRPVIDTSASRSEEARSHSNLLSVENAGSATGSEAYRRELAAFCGAIRTGAPLRISAAHARDVTQTCMAINDAIDRGKRINLRDVASCHTDAWDLGTNRVQHA